MCCLYCISFKIFLQCVQNLLQPTRSLFLYLYRKKRHRKYVLIRFINLIEIEHQQSKTSDSLTKQKMSWIFVKTHTASECLCLNKTDCNCKSKKRLVIDHNHTVFSIFPHRCHSLHFKIYYFPGIDCSAFFAQLSLNTIGIWVIQC